VKNKFVFIIKTNKGLKGIKTNGYSEKELNYRLSEAFEKLSQEGFEGELLSATYCNEIGISTTLILNPK